VSQLVAFNVTSGTGLLRVFVTVTYPGLGITELAHDGTAFTTSYARTSTRTVISGGFTYALLRVPIWPDTPTISVYAEDTGGLETLLAWSYTLQAPVPLPSPGATVPVFPVAGGASQAPVIVHDKRYFLAMMDRIMDPAWIGPLKVYPDSGYEILEAQSAIGARVSTAIQRLEAGNIIMYATGGSLATTTVEFSRPNANYGPVTIRAGTVVTTSNGGRDFVTQADAVFGFFDVGPVTVPVTAVAPSWQWNVKGEVITAGGESIPGEIDTIRAMIQIANPIDVVTYADGASIVSPGLSNTGTARWLIVYRGGTFYQAGQLLRDNGTGTGYMAAYTPTVGWFIQLDAAFPLNGDAQFPAFANAILQANTFLEFNNPSWVVVGNPTLSNTFVDPTFVVANIQDAQGGADPMLDGLGQDRGLLRKPGETDPAYRLRMRALPDTVSVNAVLRQVQQLIAPYLNPGQVAQFEEEWDVRYQTCWDAPRTPLPNPALPVGQDGNTPFDPNLFAYDDSLDETAHGLGPAIPAWDPNDPNRPAGSLPYFNRWLDVVEMRGAYIEILPNFATIADCGMAYDDTAENAAQAEVVVGTVTGHRGFGAYDVPLTADPTLIFQGGYDGFDLPKQALYLALWQLLQDTSAAGVAAIVEQQGQ